MIREMMLIPISPRNRATGPAKKSDKPVNAQTPRITAPIVTYCVIPSASCAKTVIVAIVPGPAISGIARGTMAMLVFLSGSTG